MQIFYNKINTRNAISGMYRILIAGLGNPGDSYRKNRHNAGSIMLNEMLKSSFLTNIELNNQCIIETIKSFSEMNTSGEKLKIMYNKTKYDLLIVLVDDLETELGKVKKVYPTMGHKGQNGIRNIIKHCGNDFCTIRIGIGRPHGSKEITEFVLEDFSQSEMTHILNTLGEVQGSIQTMIKQVIKNENN